MILLPTNRTKITDVPFTSVILNGYEIPFFATPQAYVDAVMFKTLANAPHYISTHKSRVWFKTSLNTAGIEGLIINITTGQVVLGMEAAYVLTQVIKGVTWKYGYFEFDNTTSFGSISNTYELRILDYSEVITKSPIRQICIGDLEKTLFFNFWNFNGNVAGFPFISANNAIDATGLTFNVEGGVQIGSVKHGLEQSTFRDQRFTPNVLSAKPRQTMVLTIGGSKGVPEYVGEQLNNILCCDTVFMNGRRIARSGDSVPEPTPIARNHPFVNFSVEVEIIKTEINVFDVATFLL